MISAILEGLYQNRVQSVNEISRLDLMNENKAKYKYVQDNASKLIKDKIDKAITDTLILRWIKGRNWEGGLGAGKDIDKMCDKLMSEYGLGADNLGDRFDRLCDFWEAQFKKDKITESSEPEKPLSKMNTNELRDYAVSLGANKKDLYGTSKSSLILIIDRIKKEGNKTFTYDVYRIVNVGDFSKDKMDVGEVKGTILDVKDKAKKFGKVISVDHSNREIIVESTINEEYVNEGKVTVDNFKKWLQQQVKDSNTPKDIKSFIQKQLNDIDTAKTKYGDDTEKKLCQKLADEIWELDITII